MSIDGWITLATLVAMMGLLARGLVSPPSAVVGATATLFVFDVIDAEQALSGLSNPAPVSVAGLYLVAAAVSRTGMLTPLVRWLAGSGGGERAALARLSVPAAGASAFLANTPIVAMLVPEVVQWSDRRRVSASRYLLPLSYATILGGALTVVGTSTNLVASGLALEVGIVEFDLFAPATVAAPMVVAGLVLTVLLAPTVLPERRAPRGGTDDARDFTVSMEVDADGPLVGLTVEAAGLRHLDGVYLTEIDRGDAVVAPVAPDRRLDAGDRLVFVGDVANVLDLQSRPGLSAAVGTAPAGGAAFYEVVVGPSSPLVGRSLRASGFRARHQAAVVAIHRAGARVTTKLGDVVVRAGDTLLLQAGPEFSGDSADARADFVVCTALGEVHRTRPGRVQLAATGLAMLVAVGLPALDVTSVLRSVTIACGIVVLAGVIRPREVLEVIDLRIVVMIAGAFGLGAAVQASGLADELADALIELTGTNGRFVAVLGVLLAAMVLTELVTNVAAVALIFPTGLAVAAATGVDPERMALGMAVAASASFLTPIGYQTNTMVWGPGRYRFTDYLRLGVPVSAVAIVGTAAMVVR